MGGDICRIRNPNERESMRIAVIGLGYVGLPLSLEFASAGVNVLGLDEDPEKVEALGRGESYVGHIASERVKENIERGTLCVSVEFSLLAEVEVIIICVPTPLNRHREPNLSFVLNTGRTIAPHLGKEVLVVLESTTYPGTTEGELRRVLEEGSGMRAGEDFHLAYSPEREDPGNPESRLRNIPKVMGGLTPACLEKTKGIYSKVVDRVVPVSSCRAAEAAKLLENIFRAVNIALVNELKMVYGEMDIDIWEVIKAASTKPFGFMPFYPGPGLGGHCIPIDPFYLTWKAREVGQNTRFIELAGEINSSMPKYVINRVKDVLNESRKAMNGSKVLVIGLAYKPNVDDVRESATFSLMDLLREGGAEVAYYDPYKPIITPSRDNMYWAGKKSICWNREVIESFDLVLISTAHDCINYEELSDWAQCIVDTRNVMAEVVKGRAKVRKA